MLKISIKELVESGVHFGHSTSRWNPKMAKYIYGKRNSIHIIDLRETIKSLLQACSFIQKLAMRGEEVIFVGTKKAAKQALKEAAGEIGAHYAVERWLGGTFTNFETIKSRVRRLIDLEELEATGRINNYSKKVISRYAREKRKLLRNLGGIRAMNRLPSCMIVIDPKRETSAIAEANRMNIPVIALTDTDSDPDKVDIMIPGNDDAFRSIKYIVSLLNSSYIDGKRKAAPVPVRDKKTDKKDGTGKAKKPTKKPEKKKVAVPAKVEVTAKAKVDSPLPVAVSAEAKTDSPSPVPSKPVEAPVVAESKTETTEG